MKTRQSILTHRMQCSLSHNHCWYNTGMITSQSPLYCPLTFQFYSLHFLPIFADKSIHSSKAVTSSQIFSTKKCCCKTSTIKHR